MLCVPVWREQQIVYLSVPLRYRMWKRETSKLELAASMVRQVMPTFFSQKNVVIFCNIWYTKKIWYVLWANTQTLISSATPDMTLLFMPLHHSLQEKEKDLLNMGNNFLLMRISPFPKKKLGIITLVYAGYLPTFLTKGKASLM